MRRERAQVYPYDYHIYDEENYDTQREESEADKKRMAASDLRRYDTIDKRTIRTKVYPYDYPHIR